MPVGAQRTVPAFGDDRLAEEGGHASFFSFSSRKHYALCGVFCECSNRFSSAADGFAVRGLQKPESILGQEASSAGECYFRIRELHVPRSVLLGRKGSWCLADVWRRR